LIVATKKATPKKRGHPVVFEQSDVYGNRVVLYRQTWEGHILPAHGHPQMAGYENLVQQTIQDPYEILPSTTFNNRFAFVSAMGIGPHALGIRAMVQYMDHTAFMSGGTSGLIVTAYPIDLAHNAPNLGSPIFKKK
jgi:hypothetical protein